MTIQPPPPAEGRLAGAARVIQSLSLSNVLVIFLLLLMAGPAYVLWKALGDEKLLDRFLSSYQEIASDTGCTIRVVAERGGPERWSISTGFAFQGADRWTVGVILDHDPTSAEGEIASYCATLTLIVDKMHQADDEQGP
jgi:hypothetical protein